MPTVVMLKSIYFSEVVMNNLYRTVLVLVFAVNMLFSTARAENDSSTTLYENAPSSSELLESLGEATEHKQSGPKTRSIIMLDNQLEAESPKVAANNSDNRSGSSKFLVTLETLESKNRGIVMLDSNGNAVTPASESANNVNSSSKNNNTVSIGKRKKVALPLTFEKGSDNLTEDAMKYVDSIADALKQKPKMSINIAGNAAEWRKGKGNRALSNKRIRAVKQYLVNQGIESRRIIASTR